MPYKHQNPQLGSTITCIGLTISMFNPWAWPLNVKTTMIIYTSYVLLNYYILRSFDLTSWHTNAYLCKRSRPLNFFLPCADEDTTSGTSFLSFLFKCWSFSIIKFSECIISFSIFQCHFICIFSGLPLLLLTPYK